MVQNFFPLLQQLKTGKLSDVQVWNAVAGSDMIVISEHIKSCHSIVNCRSQQTTSNESQRTLYTLRWLKQV